MLHEVFLLVFPVFMKFEHECIFVYVHCSMFIVLYYSSVVSTCIRYRISMSLIFNYTRLLYPAPGQSFSAENMDESFDIGDAE